MKINLHSNPPVIHQEGNLIFLANGNICLAYQLELPEIYSLSEVDFERLHSCWVQALKNLPDGTVIHKQDLYLQKKFRSAEGGNQSFLANATRRYFEGRQGFSHSSYLFFCWPKSRAFNKTGFSNPFLKIRRERLTEIERAAEFFLQAVGDTLNYLSGSGYFNLEELEEEQVSELTINYFNGFKSDVDTDIIFQGKDLVIGNRYYGMLAINNERCFADQVHTSILNSRFSSDEISFHQGYLDDLGLELETEHVVNQMIYLDDRSRWINILNKRREELLKSVNFGTQNKISLERIEEILDQVNRDDQARIVRGQTNILFWSSEKPTLLDISSRIKGALKELDIRPYEPVGMALHQYFLNSYFGFSSGISNDDLYVTDLKHILCLWLNTTNYKSDGEGILFNDRLTNTPVVKDVWDEGKKRIKARNFAIFAPTGEGKSFLANNILRQFFEAGTRLVIIDLGGSYSKFAKLYPHQHIILRYEAGKNLGINPFYIQSKDDLSPERVEDLTAFLLELSASGLKVARERQVALKKILLDYYDNTQKHHSLEGFYRYVEEHSEEIETKLRIPREFFDPIHFLHLMSEYVGTGI